MSNVYRASSGRPRMSSASTSRAMRWRALGVLGVLSVSVAVGWWLLRKPAVPVEEALATLAVAGEDPAQGEVARGVEEEAAFDATVAMQAVNGAAANGTTTRSHIGGVYAVSVVAELPMIDTASMAYEVWYVKPGITDFFSLGELYPREDGKWGLVWTQTDALVRNDIEEFSRVIIMREPRNGNVAPSGDQVLSGEF